MPPTTERPHRLSGGENPRTIPLENLRAILVAEPDVHRVHALAELPSGNFAYLIETSFSGLPKFAVGITDAENSDPSPLLQSCGRTAAENLFDILTNQ